MSLASKLADVMGAISHVEKSGRNAFHKYDYATEADIVAVVRRELAVRKVAVLPSFTIHSIVADIIYLNCELTFVDGESEETYVVRTIGSGQDKGDKGPYKAETGAIKYALLKTFLIPTGDDPEADSGPVVKKPDYTKLIAAAGTEAELETLKKAMRDDGSSADSALVKLWKERKEAVK